MMTFIIAVNRAKSEADFIRCNAWGKTAEFIRNYFSKGSMIAILGNIHAGNFTDNSGNTCEWYPAVDAASYDGAISCGQIRPCLSEAGDNVLFDFTEYAWQNAPQYLAPWLADGWSGMTALGLAGSQSTGDRKSVV